jgi:UDP-N-acetylglucosamine/UDP-N-acetylgalactosamine 4-epimerase
LKSNSITALAPIPKNLAEKLSTGHSKKWLVSGCAGFIGSNLVENLLLNKQRVVGLDNFSTGHEATLKSMVERIGSAAKNFEFHKLDIRDTAGLSVALRDVDHVCHQAALGSVPRSIADPMNSFESNVIGFNSILDATRKQGKATFVYASSSSVYGDHPALPKVEGNLGKPLSPYAGTKAANELFASIYARTYTMHCIGLRYFNVFGPRQDPDGPYAAVIPKWLAQMLRSQPVTINGDGSTSRDFCYVANAVQANILASIVTGQHGKHHVYNIAFGQRASLLQLHESLASGLKKLVPTLDFAPPTFASFRPGDVLHSLADVSAARNELGYAPEFDLQAGLNSALPWYLSQSSVVSS